MAIYVWGTGKTCTNFPGLQLGRFLPWAAGGQRHRPHWWEKHPPFERTSQLQLLPAWAVLTTRGQHWTGDPGEAQGS